MAEFIAIKRAFHNNALVSRGDRVDWPDGKKLPSWLMKPAEAAAAIAAEEKKLKAGDTKPGAAQAAVKAKATAAA